MVYFYICRPLAVGEMTARQLHAALSDGVDDIENGKTYTADEVDEELKKLYGV